MIGFKELKQEVRISNEDILLKPIVLESNSLKLNEVQVKAKAPLSREKMIPLNSMQVLQKY